MVPTETNWKCTSCNHQLQKSELVEQKGEILVFRCAECGNEAIVHFVPIPSSKPLDEACIVSIKWGKDSPTIFELSALRKLSPRFRESPVSKLKEMVDNDGRLKLGVYVKGEAMDLQREGRNLGLRIEIEECPTQENNNES